METTEALDPDRGHLDRVRNREPQTSKAIREMSIMDYNGGSCVAMVGKGCVAIASDLRLGQQALTIANNFPKIFPTTEKTLLGLTGLASDVLTLWEHLKLGDKG